MAPGRKGAQSGALNPIDYGHGANGNAMTGNREKAMEVGCYDYETKPIEFTRLMEKIKALVGEEAAP